MEAEFQSSGCGNRPANTMLWIVVGILCLGGLPRLTVCCHPSSVALHVCLNIYLEKDFPFIETLVQAKGSRQGRILLEDPDLNNICRHVTTLRDCYKNLLPECDSYWQMERYSRLMRLLSATHEYLCAKDPHTLKDLLLNTECLKRSGLGIISGCSNKTGFGWIATWKEILRMQVAPANRCLSMDAYRKCLVGRLPSVACGTEAARVYGGLVDVWLGSWCNKDKTTAAEYLYQPLAYK